MSNKAGRPRKPSRSAIATPLSAYLDANWHKTGLTNDEAAAYFGFDAPGMISMWRTGRAAVSLARLPKLAILLNVDLVAMFVLWLKQLRLREPNIPADLIELIERRLVTKNEAELIRVVRNAVKNADPAFTPSVLTRVARAVSP